jgi:membrane associated rhomboid family serine protease
MPFCPSCGAALNEGDRFCPSCGKPTNPARNIPPPPKPSAKPQGSHRKAATEGSWEATKAFLANLPNPQVTYGRFSLLSSALGFLMVAVSFNIDPMKGGGALLMVGLLIGITAFIVYFMFRSRAKALEKIRLAQDILADWTLDAQTWQQLKADQLAEDQGRAKTTLIIIAFFMFLIGGGLMVVTGFDEASVLVFKFLMGFLAFLALVAWLSWFIPHRRRSRYDTGRVIIAGSGLWINGVFHIWEGFGARIDEVLYNEEENRLSFTYSMPARHSRQYMTVHVPVPADKAEDLAKIENYFGPAEEAEENTEEEEK